MTMAYSAVRFRRSTTGTITLRLTALAIIAVGFTTTATAWAKAGNNTPVLSIGNHTLAVSWLTPTDDNTGAALVLWPDCRGVHPVHRWWAARFVEWGYQVLLLERPATPGAMNPCTAVPTQKNTAKVASNGAVLDDDGEARWLDAAIGRLAATPRVDRTRIGLVGWSMRGALQAMTAAATAARGARFRAGVAFYPDCRTPEPGHFAAPTMVLAGGRDVWIEPQACSQLVRKAEYGRAPVVTRIFAGVGHDFDHSAMGAPTTLTHNTPVAAARAAGLAALQYVREFLRQHLLPELHATPPLLLAEPAPKWSADPAQPGDNLPATGRSLLDHATHGGARIAYPFERLLDQLAPYAGPGHYGRPAIKQVLFPLGRSLQRRANAPDYFASPRIVVALDTEPGTTALPSMKDRLFLGFQPRAGIVEAISWNPALGRFEFQVIRNYRDGQTPQLAYAQRSVCISCHQNAAPLFARAPWSESNANPRIFNRLVQRHRHYQGRALVDVEPTVEHVDAATNRGALLVTWQRLWRDACGPNDGAGFACRGAALVAMLQHRLSDGAGYDQTALRFRAGLLGHQRRHWRGHWPHGLAVPTADLIDHDALAQPRMGEVPSFADPLRPRAPAEHWPAPTPGILNRFIAGLAEQIPVRLIARLDRQLGERDAHRPLRSPPLRCSLRHQKRADGSARWHFECLATVPRDTRIEGSMVVLGHIVKEGHITRLTMDGVTYNPILIIGGRLHRQHIARVVLQQRGSGLRVRTPQGHIVRLLEVDLTAGLARPLVSADFKPVIGVIDAMITARTPTLGQTPFRPETTLNEVLKRLGMDTVGDWQADVTWPNPTLDEDRDNAVVGELLAIEDRQSGAVLQRYCGHCHTKDTAFPPGFLHGDSATVAARIKICAPRMLYRLLMWDLTPTQRGKSPMPPAHSLTTLGLSGQAWRSAAQRQQLVAYLKKQVPEHLQPPRVNYAHLPSCGPAGDID